ncbi:hypothetical protein LOC67_20925 [Stieleria sp. JC731]|nr:hypothetical protein [Stieleria sp. JC731]MCC9603019.1 hypothetical protein [Stieleria sp. JC731]
MIWIGVTLASLAFVLFNVSQAPRIEEDVPETDGLKPHRRVVERRAGKVKRIRTTGTKSYYFHRSE